VLVSGSSFYLCAGDGNVAVATPPVIITPEGSSTWTGPQPGPNMPIQDVIKSLILFLASKYAYKVITNIMVAKAKGLIQLIPKPAIGYGTEPVHPPPIVTTYFPKIHPNVILPSPCQFFKRFPCQNSVFISCFPHHSYLPIQSLFCQYCVTYCKA